MRQFFMFLFCIISALYVRSNNVFPIDDFPNGGIQLYDSLRPIYLSHYPSENKKYIGQTLIYTGVKKGTKLFCSRFSSSLFIVSNARKPYVAEIWSNIYMPNKECVLSGYEDNLKVDGTNGDSIKNSRFIIRDIISFDDKVHYDSVCNLIKTQTDSLLKEQIPRTSIDNQLSGDIIILEDLKSNTKVYCNSFNNFVAEGFIEKIKSTYVDKNMIKCYREDRTLKEMNFDDKNMIYKCDSFKITVTDHDYELDLVLSNKIERKIIQCPSKLDELDYISKMIYDESIYVNRIYSRIHQKVDEFILESDIKVIVSDPYYKKYMNSTDTESERINDALDKKNINDYIAKFGNKFGPSIYRGDVEIGMTKTMCEYAGYELQLMSKSENGRTEVMKSRFGNIKVVLLNGKVIKIIK